MRKRNRLKILVIGAHPDDGEIKCGGTAAKWAARGDEVLFASLTNGQSGHHEMGAEQLVPRRKVEAAASARSLGIQSRVLGFPDGYLEPNLDARRAVISLMRTFQPDLVVTHRPNDYHPDHRYTSQVVQDTAYTVAVPHIFPETPPLRKNPLMAYLWDFFEKPAPFRADAAIAIDNVLSKKFAAMDCHVSQFYEWLPYIEGKLSEVPKARAARTQWLRRTWTPEYSKAADRFRAALVDRYGVRSGNAVRCAEAFEFCEYGRTWTAERVRAVFGGL